MIPTALEFLVEDNTPDYTDAIADVMIRFAKLHVEAALKAAAENAEIYRSDTDERYDGVNQDSILNAYPLENIK